MSRSPVAEFAVAEKHGVGPKDLSLHREYFAVVVGLYCLVTKSTDPHSSREVMCRDPQQLHREGTRGGFAWVRHAQFASPVANILNRSSRV